MIEIHEHEEFVKRARGIISKYPNRLEVPGDLGYDDGRRRVDRPVDSSPAGAPALDIGAGTVEKYSKIIEGAATVVANGPMGVFEKNGFDLGTRSILESMAKSNAYTVIGGGHLVGLASIHGIEERFSHVSTAGGAMLSLLAGQSLPGVEALVRAAKRTRSQ